MDKFIIKLLSQNWIDNTTDNGQDLCSHGKIYLNINGRVLCDDRDGDWTVASTALRLMKSALYGYDSKNDLEMIPCCGYLRLFPSCPNYINWDAKVKSSIIEISNLELSENRENGLEVIKDTYEIDLNDYSKQVLDFAQQVKVFYNSAEHRKIYENLKKSNMNYFGKNLMNILMFSLKNTAPNIVVTIFYLRHVNHRYYSDR